jgi:hypothetical protein
MAEGVERFTITQTPTGPATYRDGAGPWVRYPDYEKLEKALQEAEDRFVSCDNCERPSREEDLKTIWCREPESGEQVDARICLACRLKAERDEARYALRWALGWLNQCDEEPLPDEEPMDYERWRAALAASGLDAEKLAEARGGSK